MSKQRKIHKIVLLGDGAVGKTALRYRYLGEGFKQSYSMTIGADFAVKRVNLDGEENIAQIWDLAGQDRFKTIREVYYGGTAGALLVFDLSRDITLSRIPNWISELLENNYSRKVPMILIGNKADLRDTDSEETTIPFSTGKDYAKTLSDWANMEVPYIETSALSKQNVDEAFEILLKNIEEQRNIDTSV